MKNTKIISITWADKSKSAALIIGHTHLKITQKQMKLLLMGNNHEIESNITRESGRIEITYILTN